MTTAADIDRIVGYNASELAIQVARIEGEGLDEHAIIVATFVGPEAQQEARAAAEELHRRTGHVYMMFAFADLEAKRG